MSAFYNENDPGKAEWLRNLMAADVIAPGVVDERDIRDITPAELAGYTQCHFFAGVGIWSYALRQAGWADDRPVWTGSCPCQPFSSAGQRKGTGDERHLWPAFFHLISQCAPAVVFGEQVASPDGLAWLDLVQADMEGAGYALGAVDTCAAGFGAPHIRQRLYFGAERVANSEHTPEERQREHGGQGLREQEAAGLAGGGMADKVGRTGSHPWLLHGSGKRLADARSVGLEGISEPRSSRTAAGGSQQGRTSTGGGCPPTFGLADLHEDGQREGRECVAAAEDDGTVGDSAVSGISDATGGGCESGAGLRDQGSSEQRRPIAAYDGGVGHNRPADATNGFWRDADWLGCRDGKWRPVEPGTFPLAHGAAGRVLRLRAYGDGIVAPQAIEFIKAFDEVTR